jgi:hypothetical protein
MSLSEQPAENADPLLLALHHQISGGVSAAGGLGWWWHTPEDLPDKLDPAFLARDAQIYALLLYRLCSTVLLPLDFRPTVSELRASIAALQEAAGAHIDLEPLAVAARELAEAVEALQARTDGLSADAGREQEARDANLAVLGIGRALIPVDYTATGPFDHDLAVPTQPLPSLADCRRLAALVEDEDAYQFTRTKLLRERNRVIAGLIAARRAAEAGLG